METRNVLFVCEDNAATSIMAEAILRASGAGRFKAYSAGFHPAAAARPEVLDFLRQRSLPTHGLMPKAHGWFVEPNGPRLDFAIMLCDVPPGPAPEWNGDPVVAKWGLDEAHDIRAALWVLTRRIKIFASLPHGRASRRAILDQVHGIAIWQ